MKYKDCQKKSVVKFRQTKILNKTNCEQITVASEKLNKQIRALVFFNVWTFDEAETDVLCKQTGYFLNSF